MSAIKRTFHYGNFIKGQEASFTGDVEFQGRAVANVSGAEMLWARVSRAVHECARKGHAATDLWLGPEEWEWFEDVKHEFVMHSCERVEDPTFMGLTVRKMEKAGIRVGQTWPG